MDYYKDGYKKDYMTGDLITMVVIRRKLESKEKLTQEDRLALMMIFKHYAMLLKGCYYD